jgi:hypothetical protein
MSRLDCAHSDVIDPAIQHALQGVKDLKQEYCSTSTDCRRGEQNEIVYRTEASPYIDSRIQPGNKTAT